MSGGVLVSHWAERIWVWLGEPLAAWGWAEVNVSKGVACRIWMTQHESRWFAPIWSADIGTIKSYDISTTRYVENIEAGRRTAASKSGGPEDSRYGSLPR